MNEIQVSSSGTFYGFFGFGKFSNHIFVYVKIYFNFHIKGVKKKKVLVVTRN